MLQHVVITSATKILAITPAIINIIGNNISLSGLPSTTIYMAITSAINNNQIEVKHQPLWFNIYHVAITSANNHVSIQNGITSAITTSTKMLKLKYYRHIFPDTLLVYIKVWSLTVSSDLRKPGLVPGKSLSLATILGSVLEKINYT